MPTPLIGEKGNTSLNPYHAEMLDLQQIAHQFRCVPRKGNIISHGYGFDERRYGFLPVSSICGISKKKCAALTGCALLYRAKCALVEQGLVSGKIPVMGGTDGMETCSRTTYSNSS